MKKSSKTARTVANPEAILYSVQTTAKKFDVHPNTVTRWIKSKAIPSVRVGDTVRVPAAYVDSLGQVEATECADITNAVKIIS